RDTARTGPAVATDVTIRMGTPEDTLVAATYDRQLHLHLERSPSFSGLTAPDDQTYLDEWRNLPNEEEVTHFVAERDGRIVGQLVLYKRPEGDLRVPPHSIDLAHALTEPGVRGTGAGLALTDHGLRWAHEHGYRTMITDWRMTNLLASRFWPKRGFRETFLR